jgi:hypothetical protein
VSEISTAGSMVNLVIWTSIILSQVFTRGYNPPGLKWRRPENAFKRNYGSRSFIPLHVIFAIEVF